MTLHVRRLQGYMLVCANVSIPVEQEWDQYALLWQVAIIRAIVSMRISMYPTWKQNYNHNN
jgi:hypothetical protein